MPDRPESTPPPLDEGDTFRETTLQLIDDPEDRDVARRFGRLLHQLAVETSREMGTNGDPSLTRSEIRAAAADLRSLGDYLHLIERSAEWCSLDAEDEKLARFAGRLSRKVVAMVDLIEVRLS